jgi:hypothetical protein
MFMEVLGVPPPSLISKGARSGKFFEGTFPRIRANSKGKLRKPNSKSIEIILSESPDVEFIQFIKKLLVWDPESRLAASEALM